MQLSKLESFRSSFDIDYQKNLNQYQLEVIENADGPCLVLAGAGSGKTRVLIYRLAYLLDTGVLPENILLVTFTNKAGREMIHRAENLLKSPLQNLWAGTFHHIGNIILRNESHRLGYSSNFTIIDRDDACDLIDDCIEELGLDKQIQAFPKKDLILSIHGLAINSLREIDDVIAQSFSHVDNFTVSIKRILALYEKHKKEANIMDFDDLLYNWLLVLNNPAVRQLYSGMFKYILVDEYQDTNKLQFEIVRKLCETHKNILAVGDDAQSIYSFRSAEINNILDFSKTFKNAKIFKLETNYRSSPEILHLANDSIKHNLRQFSKNLQAMKPSGQLPLIIKTEDVYQQARFIAQRINELNHNGFPLQEIAVLFRSRFLSMELEMELLKRNIPYLVRGGVKFFEQSHIKDIMAYIKFLVNPKDELAFKRAICLHQGIGRNYALKIWDLMVNQMKPISEIEKLIPKRPRTGFYEFAKLIEIIRPMESAQAVIVTLLNSYKDYCYVNFDNSDERIAELEELAKMAAEYSEVKKFLTELNSYEEFKGEAALSKSERREILILSTIHQAKGLEWQAVFIIGCTDYDFPHPKSLISEKAIEEERRLFYVAATRSKSLLYITYPKTKHTYRNGIITCRQSPFITELDPKVYEKITIGENY